MTLNDFIANLQKLQAEGHGDLEVFYQHGSSGDAGYLGHAFQEEIDGTEDCGELCDMDVGEKYISVYAGN
jgi:hypothetical protein